MEAIANKRNYMINNLQEQELRDFVKLWDDAMVTNNANEIGTFMADDWVIIGSDGVTGKPDFLQWISSGIVTHDSMTCDEMSVRLYGDTGIVITRGTSAGTYNGEKFRLYEWSTNIFRKSDDSWLCVLTMLTPASKTQ